MSRIIIISILITIVGYTAFGHEFFEKKTSQINWDIPYLVSGKYNRSITKETLNKATLISDVILNYPFNWISDFDSVEILTFQDGNEISTTSPNDVLSTEQKMVFNSIDISDDFIINVNYKTENAVTTQIDHRQMRISFTVIPAKEAEYIGGYDELISYLKENSIAKISERSYDQLVRWTTIVFTVTEKGEIENVHLTKKSEDVEGDKILIELIEKMPVWQPAENSEGLKVKQKFEFNVGMPGC